VLFDLTPPTFTLSQLQAAAEAVTGVALHKQNFRRGVERTGLVAATGGFSTGTGAPPPCSAPAASTPPTVRRRACLCPRSDRPIEPLRDRAAPTREPVLQPNAFGTAERWQSG
jgi:hypothetical protein